MQATLGSGRRAVLLVVGASTLHSSLLLLVVLPVAVLYVVCVITAFLAAFIWSLVVFWNTYKPRRHRIIISKSTDVRQSSIVGCIYGKIIVCY